VLGIVDVLQRVHEQVIHRLDVPGEETHGSNPPVSERSDGRRARRYEQSTPDQATERLREGSGRPPVTHNRAALDGRPCSRVAT
jgi:hypothetical protein